MGMTVRQVLERFYAYVQARNAPGTLGYYRYHLERFAAIHGEKRADELKKWDLISWARTWHAAQCVQRLFRWAHSEAELIPVDPFKGTDKPPVRGRKRILLPSELVRLIRSFSAPARRFFIAMYQTIARPQEIRSLRWEHIRWTGRHADLIAAMLAGDAYFVLDSFKGESRRKDRHGERVLFISRRLARLLIRMSRSLSSLHGPIFLDTSSRPWTANAIRLQMRRACKRARLDRDRRGEQIVPYTLRHTAATKAVAAGVTDRTLADLMGHTTTRTTARYQHLTTAHLRSAFAKIEAHKER